MADDMKLQILLEATNDTGTAFNSFLGSLRSATRDINEMTKSLSNFTKAVTPDMGSASRAVDEFLTPVTQGQTDFEGLTKSVSEMAKTAESASRQASEALAAIQTPLQGDVADIKNVTAELGNMAKEAETAGRQMAESVALPAVGGKTQGVGSGGHGESGGLFGIQGQMDTMYAGMAMGGAALPLDAGIKAAISSFTQFDQAMANVNSMANMSTQQLAQMSQQVINLSKTVPIGPVQLANALYGVVGAGVPAADAMNFLKTASEASVAGQTDLTTATNALVYVMGSYGLKAKDMTKVSDEMFAANAAGAMTFQQFASSLGTVSGAAAQAGVPFDQIAAATAALTNDGISAQRATLGLRALLMGIVAPTKGATKEAAALGIQWDQNALKSKGLTGMLQEAMQATHGNAQELKKLIPNIAGWTVAVDLGGKGAQSFTNAMNQMNNSAGATARAMQAQTQGTGEQIDKMKASIQTAEIAFVQGFAPAITAVSEDVSKLAQWFANLSPHTRKVAGEIAIGAAAFLTLGSAMFMSLSAIGSLVGGVERVIGVFAAETAAAGEAAAATEAFAVAETEAGAVGEAGLFSGLLGSLKSVGGLLRTITIEPLISGFTALKAIRLETIGEGITKMAETVEVGMTRMTKFVVDSPKLMLSGIDGLMNGMGAAFARMGAMTETLFATMTAGFTWEAIMGKAKAALALLTGPWGILIAAVVAGVTLIITHWSQITAWVKQNFGTSIPQIMQHMKEDLNAVWNGIKAAAQAVWNFLEPYIMGAVNKLATFWKQIWPELRQLFQEVWTVMKIILSPIIAWMGLIVVTTLGFIKGAWENAWNAIKDVLKFVWDAITGVIRTAWDLISGIIKIGLDLLTGHWGKAWDDVKSTFKNVWNDITGMFGNLLNDALDFGKNFVMMIAKGIEGAVGAVVSAVSHVASKIASHLGFHSPTEEGPGSDADTWMPNMMNMFVQGIQSKIPQLQSTLQSALASPFQNATAMVSGSMSQSMVLGGAGSGTAGGAPVYITVQGSVIRERELVDMVQRGQWQKMKNQNKF